MQLEAAMQAFFEGYFATNECGDKTRSAYCSDIAQFAAFIGKTSKMRRITGSHIEKWIVHLKSNEYRPASIRRKIVVLKVFFGYWVRRGLIRESPFCRVKIQLGKIVQLPRTLDSNEITKMLAHAHDANPSQPQDTKEVLPRNGQHDRSLTTQFMMVRNATLLEVLFATGMRAGEASALDISDFVRFESLFVVHGKGGRQRLAHVVDAVTVRTLEKYLSLRRHVHTESQAFFLNCLGHRLSTQGIASIVRRIRVGCGIERHVTPHMLRHTVATMLLQNGVDVRIIQEFLGHASITTTQRYTNVSKGHLVRELQNRHPSLTIRPEKAGG